MQILRLERPKFASLHVRKVDRERRLRITTKLYHSDLCANFCLLPLRMALVRPPNKKEEAKHHHQRPPPSSYVRRDCTHTSHSLASSSFVAHSSYIDRMSGIGLRFVVVFVATVVVSQRNRCRASCSTLLLLLSTHTSHIIHALTHSSRAATCPPHQQQRHSDSGEHTCAPCSICCFVVVVVLLRTTTTTEQHRQRAKSRKVCFVVSSESD